MPTSPSRMRNDGFSLIELLIVVAILGLVALLVVPSISNTFRFSVKSAAREIATLIREASNSAQISGKTHRLAFDFKTDQYWVESTSQEALLDTEASKEIDKKKSKKEEEEKPKSPFSQENGLTKKKRTLPIGVHFEKIFTEQTQEPLTEGLAYVHLFPMGQSEKALIILKDTGKNEISVIVKNLLGRTDIEGRALELKEAFPQ